MRQLTHGSLFAGIGGFDLGFERAGIKTVWQVEIDPFCRKVLEKNFPNAERFTDIQGCGRHNLKWVDVITGGFPCQDISHAGKRAGIDGERSGLWKEMLSTIRMVRPKYAVVENVAALLGRGVGRVLGDLAESGYDAEWDCLPACAFGAPHQRDRCFVVADNHGQRRQGRWFEAIREFAPFPWFQDVRGIEDVRNRPDLPEPLIRRTGNGVSARLHAIGNSVIPQIAEYIGRRIVACHEQMEREGK